MAQVTFTVLGGCWVLEGEHTCLGREAAGAGESAPGCFWFLGKEADWDIQESDLWCVLVSPFWTGSFVVPTRPGLKVPGRLVDSSVWASGLRLKVLPICRPSSRSSPGPAPCRDVTLVIIKFMSPLEPDAAAAVPTATVELEAATPSVVTLAILISESGSVLLSAALPEGGAASEGGAREEESFCSKESSSSSITMVSLWLWAAVVGAGAGAGVEKVGVLAVGVGAAAVTTPPFSPQSLCFGEGALG